MLRRRSQRTLSIAFAAAVAASSLGVPVPTGASPATYLGVRSDRTVALAGATPTEVAAQVSQALPASVHLQVDEVRRSPLGRHIRGRQVRGGVPVDGTWFVAWVSRGRLRSFEARYSALPGRPSRAGISRSDAIGAVADVIGSEPLIRPRVERLLVPHAGALRDRWRVWSLSADGPTGFDVDASSGSVVTQRHVAVYEDTSATVFDPNPIVALKDNSVRQPGADLFGVDTDLDEARLTAALVRLPLRDVDEGSYASGRLVGPNVDVQGPAPLTPGNSGFSFTRGDPRFETTMAYAHLDALQRYIQDTLGLKDVNAEPQNVYAAPVAGFDNSFYMGGQDIIVLGAGGVDDGEDAEVIVHEYGHAIHDDQVPGWGASSEAGAMGEGFGDFLAAAYFARTSSRGFQDTCIADWDATSYSTDDPPCLRRLDTGKRYPDDVQGQVHADGEIWSGFLWKLRSLLGSDPVSRSDNVLKLLLVSHELLTPESGFKEAVAALRDSARALGKPGWAAHVKRAAAEYGLD